ncbi:MAG: hypothetical protein CMF12_13730 [Idiomarina sp.]|uniref:hypothetical protein n=1 Tax=Idiomarina sp. TaxID=1874361 RepID=UPI000C61372B|nr:hypothetical protein [Idiomarina sp.]MBT43566.1 hypothetical protein [Idiomarina sp.]
MFKWLKSSGTSTEADNGNDNTPRKEANSEARIKINAPSPSPRFEPKMEISEKLLATLESWDVIDLPNRLYHGCQSTDSSVNIQKLTLKGNKWFSTYIHYAGAYAWHNSRKSNPPPNSRYCLELASSKTWRGVKRPKDFVGFPSFLSDCFGMSGYCNSLQFQSVLQIHLHKLFGKDSDIIGYYWPDGGDKTDEICVPACQQFYSVESAILLPDDKGEFNKQYGRHLG